MKKILFSLLLCLNTLLVFSQDTETMYLSGTDKDHTVTWDFMCTSGRNPGVWGKIAVPSNWELQGYGSYHYGKTDLAANEKGLYKYNFTVPASWKNKLIYIVFEGSMTDTDVRINGKSAGPVHQGAFYRFKYDITGLINLKGTNLLEASVSKESANESINRAERISDFWVFGGIFRPVYLEAVPSRFIDRVAIDAKADGSFYMDVFTAGPGKAASVSARVLSADGTPFGKPFSATIDGTGKAVLKASFSEPLTWNPEYPNLYKVEISLLNGRKTIHRTIQKFGFRTVELREGDGIYVNGTKIMFRGVCRHTFWPSSGRTSSRELATGDIRLMKEMNMNAVRMSHYPPDQYFLDACDSMGMFVLDELTGWQKFYDTPTAQRLVKELVIRDVNHPSIVLWDNGNEGGFNKDVRGDYALYDPQKRTVIEPWSIINGTNTKHYPGYKYVENALNNGKEIFFPTEFLHGLFDGGLGAGLDDEWKLMNSKPLAAGAFLWVFADEGVERKDKNDSIDTDGNRAPDGILGPYHQKEGSFYTVRDIWSPVQFDPVKPDGEFKGVFGITNHYLYSNLKTCSFSWELVKYADAFPSFRSVRISGKIASPDVEPGKPGKLVSDLPDDWRSYDVLYIEAADRNGMELNTWSWNIKGPAELATRSIGAGSGKVSIVKADSLIQLTAGETEALFSARTGLLKSVKSRGRMLSLANGPRFAGFAATVSSVLSSAEGDNPGLTVNYADGSMVKWSMLPGGTLKLDYSYSLNGLSDYAGITFSYPEDQVTGALLMANGPYHVWKNRLRGPQFGIFDKMYNNTVTGESWDYPEFKGYYSNFYAVEIRTKELPFTIINATNDVYLHLFTPGAAKYSKNGVRGEVNPAFPTGNISVLNAISPIGTKFTKAEAEGPSGQKNSFNGEKYSGTLYFKFGN
jgi:hypothetical protein